METTFKSFKGIGTFAIACFAFAATPFPAAAAQETEHTQLNSILSALHKEQTIEMTDEQAEYIHALQEHYE
ncbi:MAG: hypothetical protein WBG70_08220 [Spirulinaceae cyanobacterium]